jgi:hypothetical protein
MSSEDVIMDCMGGAENVGCSHELQAEEPDQSRARLYSLPTRNKIIFCLAY